MFTRQIIRRGVPLMLLAIAGCGDAARGNAGADTAHPSAVAAPAPLGGVPASKDTTALSHPHAGAPPALVIGATTILLDSTTFVDVSVALGRPAIVDDSTGDYRALDACYVAGAGADRVTVRLSAGDFMSDPETTEQAMATLPINQVSIARGDPSPRRSSAPKRCVPLSVSPAMIHWSNGLRLGMTRPEAEGLLGPPQKRDEDDWVYSYDEPYFHRVSIDRVTGREMVTTMAVTVGVQVRYDNGVATRIEAWYSMEPNSEMFRPTDSSAR
jgi:hypothetical protein